MGPTPSNARFPPRPFRSALGACRYLCGAVLLYAVLFNVSVVRGNSMSPGIHDGDRILVQPWSLFFGEVDRGDVIVMRYPLDPELDYIKRVIGLPGDEIVLAGGQVWVNGEELVEPYIDEQDADCYQRVTVDDEHYFVLGDNRRRSSDSREFGQVPADNVRGIVDVRLWPLERLGWIR